MWWCSRPCNRSYPVISSSCHAGALSASKTSIGVPALMCGRSVVTWHEPCDAQACAARGSTSCFVTAKSPSRRSCTSTSSPATQATAGPTPMSRLRNAIGRSWSATRKQSKAPSPFDPCVGLGAAIVAWWALTWGHGVLSHPRSSPLSSAACRVVGGLPAAGPSIYIWDTRAARTSTSTSSSCAPTSQTSDHTWPDGTYMPRTHLGPCGHGPKERLSARGFTTSGADDLRPRRGPCN